MAPHSLRLDCFGGSVEVAVLGGNPRKARDALDEARRRLRVWHDRLTRFEARSELSRLNADPRREVPASDVMLSFAAAVRPAGEMSGGLVDATLLGAIEAAGYDRTLRGLDDAPSSSPAALARPARQLAAGRWRLVSVDHGRGVVVRPPGVRLDSGGLAKGLAADDIVRVLAGFARFTVNCCGDLRLGGADPRLWRIDVTDPWGGPPVAAVDVPNGTAVATSGITNRTWSRAGGRAGHHLIDPATGEPAFTGVIQATALAPTGLEAEVRAKAALLSGPSAGPGHLTHGGVLVLDGGRIVEVPAAATSEAAA